MNGGLFAALAIQQTTLFLVIGLIVAVSTFNVVATLVMTVQEKKRDIGVLTTLGAEPGFFSRVFLSLGALLGRDGRRRRRRLRRPRLLGDDPVPAAVVPARCRRDLLRLVHPVSRPPAKDLAAIVGFSALAILLAAAWVPARRASRIDVAEALRYE